MAKEYALVEACFNAWDGEGRQIFRNEKWRMVVCIAFPPFGGLIPAVEDEIKNVLIKVCGLGPDGKEPEVEIAEHSCGKVEVIEKFTEIEDEKDYHVTGTCAIYDKTNGVLFIENIRLDGKVPARLPEEAEENYLNMLRTSLRQEYNIKVELQDLSIKAKEISQLPKPPKQAGLF